MQDAVQYVVFVFIVWCMSPNKIPNLEEPIEMLMVAHGSVVIVGKTQDFSLYSSNAGGKAWLWQIGMSMYTLSRLRKD